MLFSPASGLGVACGLQGVGDAFLACQLPRSGVRSLRTGRGMADLHVLGRRTNCSVEDFKDCGVVISCVKMRRAECAGVVTLAGDRCEC